MPRPSLTVLNNPNFRGEQANVTLPPIANAASISTVSLQSSYLAAPSAEFKVYASHEALKRLFDPISDGDAMADQPRDDQLLDAKFGKAAAETDTKIARMEGKLDLVISKIDGVNSKFDDVRNDYRTIRANIWVVGLGLLVAIVSVAALFPVFFGVGAQVRDLVHSEIQLQLPHR